MQDEGKKSRAKVFFIRLVSGFYLPQFIKEFLILFGLMSASGTACPCCGQSACPLGFANFAIFSFAFALLMKFLRRIKTVYKEIAAKIRSE